MEEDFCKQLQTKPIQAEITVKILCLIPDTQALSTIALTTPILPPLRNQMPKF